MANANDVPAASHIDQMLIGVARRLRPEIETNGPSPGDPLDDLDAVDPTL
jgi:hypothetical protein